MKIKNIKKLDKKYKIFNDEGGTSTIYSDNNQLLYKIFCNYRDVFFEKRLEKMSKLNTSFFAVPIENIYLKNKLIGYIMYRKDGVTFEKLNSNTLIEDLLNSFFKLEDDLKILSLNNIRILDLHDENILFDSIKKEINIIDTDEYGTLYTYEDLYNVNIRSIAILLLDYLNLKKYNIDSNNIDSIKTLITNIKQLIYILEEINKKEINRVGDIKALSKVL